MGFFSRAGQIKEEWSLDTKAPLVCPVAVARIGTTAVVVIGTKDGRIICCDAAGKQRWTYATGEKLGATESFFVDETRVHAIDAPPVIADVNRDGKLEVLAGSELGVLYCLSMEGKLLWKRDCKGPIRNAPLVEDMNMDGAPEILIGAGSKLVALTGNGEPLFEYVSTSPVESIPGVLKASKPLIVFGNDEGMLTAITPAQDKAWHLKLNGKITAAPVTFQTPEELRLVIGTLAGSMYCVSEHGELVWEFKTQGSIYSKAAIYDLDHDHLQEIIFGSCDNNVYAVTEEGKRMWSYETDFWVTATPVIADVDGDGKPEVIAGSYDHNLYVLDGQGEYMMEYVPGIAGIIQQAGHYSSLLTSEPGEQAGKKRFQYTLPSMIVGCTLLEGADGAHLVAATKDGKVTTLKYG